MTPEIFEKQFGTEQLLKAQIYIINQILIAKNIISGTTIQKSLESELFTRSTTLIRQSINSTSPKMLSNRRCNLEKLTLTERTIHDAITAVENLPGTTTLTEAINLLVAAKDKVSNYEDNQICRTHKLSNGLSPETNCESCKIFNSCPLKPTGNLNE
ncbi:MAG: hypothetical protein Q7K40_03120 [bacterium]|nr:hypothetical protein [bacterium]